MSEKDALVDNAADREQVQAAQRKEKRQQTRFRDALKRVINTPDGEIVFRELVVWGRIFGSVYDESHPRMALREGERNYVLKLLAHIAQADKTAVAKLITHPSQQEQPNG